MKKLILSVAILLSTVLPVTAQYLMTDTYVNDMHGESRPLKDFIEMGDGKVTLFVFWKTCCPTNISMIDSLNELKEEDYSDDRIKIRDGLPSAVGCDRLRRKCDIQAKDHGRGDGC